MFFENEALESQSGMNQERSGSEQCIEAANRKQGVMSLPPAASAPMKDVKDEYVVLATADGSDLELSSAARETHEVVEYAMMFLCFLYYVPFQGLLEALEQSGDDIFEGVHSVMCNPPYNTRRIMELSNSKHNWIILQDMILFGVAFGIDLCGSA